MLKVGPHLVLQGGVTVPPPGAGGAFRCDRHRGH